jgi:hypothetical protein
MSIPVLRRLRFAIHEVVSDHVAHVHVGVFDASHVLDREPEYSTGPWVPSFPPSRPVKAMVRQPMELA